jgi:4-aminobutyrate aminotransferase-like enzyme
VRIAPPLVVTEEQLQDALKIIKESIEELPHLVAGK